MRLPICDFELSKKLKKVGFDQKYNVFDGDNYYNYKGELNGCQVDALKHRKEDTDKYDNISAPTLALVQMWFMEKYKIQVTPIINIYTDLYGYEIYNGSNEDEFETIDYNPNSDEWDFKTYDQALEAGILEAIKLIKN